MAKFEVKAPNGKLFEVNAPEGSTEDQAIAYIRNKLMVDPDFEGTTISSTDVSTEIPVTESLEPVMQEAPIESGYGSDFLQRIKKAEDIKQRYASGETSLPSSALQGLGNVGFGTLHDVVGRTLGKAIGMGARGFESVAPETAQSIKNVASEALQSPVGQSVLSTAGKIGEEWEGLRESYPDAIGNIEALGNIAMGVPSGFTVAKGVGKPLEATGEALIKSGQKSKAKAALDLVMPIKDTGRKREVSGIVFKTKKTVPTKQEIESAKELSKIKEFNPNKLIEENVNVVEKQIGKEANNLKAKLAKEDANFLKEIEVPFEKASGLVDEFGSPIITQGTRKETVNTFNIALDEAISGLKKSETLVGDAQKISINLANKMKEFVEDSPATPAGLLDARQKFDQWVKQSKPKMFDQNFENGLSAANRVIRKTTNDFIAKNSKNIDVKESLARQSALYRALDNMKPKADIEAKTSLGRLAQKADKQSILKSNMVKGIGATAGIGALGGLAYMNPVLIPAIAGTYGAYKTGKALISPQSRIGVGEALRALGNPKNLIKK
jgi:hypothetical protein